MINSIEQAKKYLENAQGIKSGMASFFLENVQPIRSKLTEITHDTTLSIEGQYLKKAEVKKQAASELIGKLHTRKQQYVAELQKANKIADKLVYSLKKKPDDETLRRFEQSFKELKTQIALSTRPESANAKLKDFIDKIKDPYLADIVRDDFQEIASSIINNAGSDAGLFKTKLAQTYDHLRDGFETEEIREARLVLEYTEQTLENPKLMYSSPDGTPTIYDTAAREVIGDNARYINDTDSFYAIEGNEGLKPADYVDPELKEQADKQANDDKWANISKAMEEKIKSGELKI